MKTIFFKTIFILSIFFIHNCKAQTTNDYITFYNGVVPKLNIIVPYKTQFYGQNFSTFYTELLSKQISVAKFGCDYKTDPGSKYYVLDLFFEDSEMWPVATNNSFQYPWVSITFQDEIPAQIKTMILQNHGEWNSTFAQFFANMKIEKILFVGVNGYNSTDWKGK
ncbi:hypothetical protein [Chryseobacterium limigenitum]|uniref:Uncharacterized protein n=1 Tax=Chryseobacterium limigenitum TaxID=1612149 RepID=A0A1K2IFY3_9FLAO|nr:hypothetical protein [Chryseobacterium limigenitum]SFZ91321.1 hypothetical protein SAMN05216324_102302 [Chryseobacterium limigenitum]